LSIAEFRDWARSDARVLGSFEFEMELDFVGEFTGELVAAPTEQEPMAAAHKPGSERFNHATSRRSGPQ
jgi:hypothetical protein